MLILNIIPFYVVAVGFIPPPFPPPLRGRVRRGEIAPLHCDTTIIIDYVIVSEVWVKSTIFKIIL
jgi:hypothetical protein